jgi:hypothetical protein
MGQTLSCGITKQALCRVARTRQCTEADVKQAVTWLGFANQVAGPWHTEPDMGMYSGVCAVSEKD